LAALLGAALLRVSVPPTEDPGYTISPVAALLIAALAAVVVVAAPRLRIRPARPARPPRVLVVACATAVTAFGFLALIWPFAGARQPLFTHGAWALLPMAAAASVAAGAVLVLRRWSADPGWAGRHLLAACLGAVVGHTVFGLVAQADSLPDRLFLAAVAILTATIGFIAVRRLEVTGVSESEPPRPFDPAHFGKQMGESS
jgi:hypothetical protein